MPRDSLQPGTEPLTLYPFRFRDSLTGKWVRAPRNIVRGVTSILRFAASTEDHAFVAITYVEHVPQRHVSLVPCHFHSLAGNTQPTEIRKWLKKFLESDPRHTTQMVRDE